MSYEPIYEYKGKLNPAEIRKTDAEILSSEDLFVITTGCVSIEASGNEITKIIEEQGLFDHYGQINKLETIGEIK